MREKANEKGLNHFKLGDQELSLLHFNLDNAKALNDSQNVAAMSTGTGAKKVPEGGSKVKGACYGYNYNKEGCTTKDCKWEHRCLTCKSKDHSIEWVLEWEAVDGNGGRRVSWTGEQQC